jgi:hypothetical protein
LNPNEGFYGPASRRNAARSRRVWPAADEDAMLAEVTAGFEKLAADPGTLAAYRAESEEIESGFEVSTAAW